MWVMGTMGTGYGVRVASNRSKKCDSRVQVPVREVAPPLHCPSGHPSQSLEEFPRLCPVRACLFVNPHSLLSCSHLKPHRAALTPSASPPPRRGAVERKALPYSLSAGAAPCTLGAACRAPSRRCARICSWSCAAPRSRWRCRLRSRWLCEETRDDRARATAPSSERPPRRPPPQRPGGRRSACGAWRSAAIDSDAKSCAARRDARRRARWPPPRTPAAAARAPSFR